MARKVDQAGRANFVIHVDRNADFRLVASALRKAGLKVERELPSIGILGGSGRRTLLQAMQNVQGVKDIREEGSFTLPPMSDDLPQ